VLFGFSGFTVIGVSARITSDDRVGDDAYPQVGNPCLLAGLHLSLLLDATEHL
jgi:hypothetical protein